MPEHDNAEHDNADHGIFDKLRPPSAALAEDCVHCGLCLPSCPTYALWGQEMDSPRGRIHLVKLGLSGDATMSESYREHFDACLGCMACVSACPSGVQYEPLLAATRAQLERHAPRSRRDRLFRSAILTFFPSRFWLRVAVLFAWFYQRLGVRRVLDALGARRRLPARLRALDELMPEVALRDVWAGLPDQLDSQGEPRMRVALVAGCVQSVFFRGVNLATARVLAAEGCEVIIPQDAGCCGALAAHSGADDRARAQARSLIEVFEAYDDGRGHGLDRIVVNAAGCGATLRHYDQLFADEPEWRERASRIARKICDISEVVNELADEHGSRAERRPIAAGRVIYHDACHLAHAQGVRAAPRRMLASIPGLEVVEVPHDLADHGPDGVGLPGDACCGSAGIYNLVQPGPAEELGRRKAGVISSLGESADGVTLAAGNPGCLLQLRRFLDPDIRLVHPIELLAESIGVSEQDG